MAPFTGVHHIGVATRNIDKDVDYPRGNLNYRIMLQLTPVYPTDSVLTRSHFLLIQVS
jgi:hypothetical protein